jgi:tRNA G18 (ribose-2'-O)-methylase SpoU
MNTKRSNTDLGRPDLGTYKGLKKNPVHVVLDNVRSAQNVGSFFRTMDAFRCAGLYLCGITPKPPHRDINKTALGATASVQWKYFPQTSLAIEQLKAANVSVFAVEQAEGSVGLDEFHLKSERKVAFVFGNEVEGVNQEIIDQCDGVVEIPQFGTKHSLNIAVCAGIVLWHTHGRKLRHSEAG